MLEWRPKKHLWCIVPKCTNTGRVTPNKRFITVPKDEAVKKLWWKAIRRNYPIAKGCLYCCEDHFNLKEDTENYLYFTTMGGPIRLKKGVLPHMFECQDKVQTPNPHRINLQQESILQDMVKENWKGAVPTATAAPGPPAAATVVGAAADAAGEVLSDEDDNRQEEDYNCGAAEPEKQKETIGLQVVLKVSGSKSMDPTNIKYEQDFSPEYILPDDPPVMKRDPLLLEYSVDQVSSAQDGTAACRTDGPLDTTPEQLSEDVKEEMSEGQLSEDVKEEMSEGGSDVEAAHSGGASAWCGLCSCQCLGQSPLDRHVEHRHSAICGNSEIKSEQRGSSLDKKSPTKTREQCYCCSLCDKTFRCNSKLNRHLVTCKGPKPHACDVCGKAFSWKSGLTKHRLSHSGQKPYSCDVCGKTFNQKGHLTTHLLTHSGQKPYSCDVCGKTFNQKCHMTTHLLTHSGQKPYCCDVCGKAFRRKCHITRHLLSHTGQKSHCCDVCGKAFVHGHTLKEHIRTHTGQKPYSCGVCGKTFRRRFYMVRHVLTQHGAETAQHDTVVRCSV